MRQSGATEPTPWVSPAMAIWAAVVSVVVICLLVGALLKEAIAVGKMTSPTSKDAPVGTELRLPSRDYLGRPIDPNLRTLLVYGGSCTGCSLNSVKPSDVQNSPFEQIAFVYVASDEQLAAQFGRNGLRALIIADTLGSIGEKLGAMTAPRFYVLEAGAIKEIWKDIDQKPDEWLGEKK